MASKWRIFGHAQGTSFLVDLYSVVKVSASGCANVVMTSQYLLYLRRHLFIYLVFVNLRTRQDTTGMLSPSHGAFP